MPVVFLDAGQQFQERFLMYINSLVRLPYGEILEIGKN